MAEIRAEPPIRIALLQKPRLAVSFRFEDAGPIRSADQEADDQEAAASPGCGQDFWQRLRARLIFLNVLALPSEPKASDEK